MAWSPPRTWVAGEKITAALLNTEIRDNLLAFGGAWQDYTPEWSSTGTQPGLVDGTIAGHFAEFGDFVIVRLVLTAGSFTSFGTGNWRFTYPKQARLHTPWHGHGGWFHVKESGGGRYFGMPRYVSPDTFTITYRAASQAGVLASDFNATGPLTWQSGDNLDGTFFYEAV